MTLRQVSILIVQLVSTSKIKNLELTSLPLSSKNCTNRKLVTKSVGLFCYSNRPATESTVGG